MLQKTARKMLAFTTILSMLFVIPLPVAYAMSPIGPKTLPQISSEEQQEEVVEFDARNASISAYMDEVEYTYPNAESKVDRYSPLGSANWKPTPYVITSDGAASLSIIDMVTWKEAAATVIHANDEFKIYNLIPGKAYKWTTFDSDHIPIKSGQIMPTSQLRSIYGQGLMNVRDMGGWEANGGKIKYGLLFRGGSLDNTADLDKSTLDSLGITCELDLRTDGEAYSHDIEFANAVDGWKSRIPFADYIRISTTGYEYGLRLDRSASNATIRALREIMLQTTYGQPIYFHCAAGADRTGTIAFLIEGLLGVSYDDLCKDYELTSFGFADHNRNCDGVGFQQMMDLIESMPGEDLEGKFIAWFLEAGFSVDELNAFRVAAIDGEPTTIRLQSEPERAVDAFVEAWNETIGEHGG